MQRKPKAAQNGTDPHPAQPFTDNAVASDSKYRVNPQVEADLAAWKERHPKQVEYVKSLPRERLENSYFLRLLRAERQREVAREAIASRFMADPALLQAYMERAQKIIAKMNLGPADDNQVKAAALELYLGERRNDAVTARKLQSQQQTSSPGPRHLPMQGKIRM